MVQLPQVLEELSGSALGNLGCLGWSLDNPSRSFGSIGRLRARDPSIANFQSRLLCKKTFQKIGIGGCKKI